MSRRGHAGSTLTADGSFNPPGLIFPRRLNTLQGSFNSSTLTSTVKLLTNGQPTHNTQTKAGEGSLHQSLTRGRLLSSSAFDVTVTDVRDASESYGACSEAPIEHAHVHTHTHRRGRLVFLKGGPRVLCRLALPGSGVCSRRRSLDPTRHT